MWMILRQQIEHGAAELAAAFLQTTITAGVALTCVYLYLRLRRSHYAIWSLAWTLYALRMVAIIGFIVTEARPLLYWHQVLAGWTAFAFLAAAVSFSQRIRWRPWHALALLLPPLWSYVAIYELDSFLLAAGAAVVFLAGATAWTGAVLWLYHRRFGSPAAGITAGAFFLWSVHRLDYPFLRARGAWNPWGYYLDIVFVLAIGSGILLMVFEEQRRGLTLLSTLSGDLQTGRGRAQLLEGLLARLLTLPAVTGGALYSFREKAVLEGVGTCAGWRGEVPAGAAARAIDGLEELGRPRVVLGHSPSGPGHPEPAGRHPFATALPLFQADEMAWGLLVVGDAPDPFAALDESTLVTLGHQVGAALENARLHDALEERSGQLEHLAARMVQQQEEERRQLSRELHDESAQVFAALRMQLGVIREATPPEHRSELDRAEQLVAAGVRSIRAAARNLRPVLLDDLGLVAALRALCADFSERTRLPVDVELPDDLGPLTAEAELALYRALQEGLSNVARHARSATRVRCSVGSVGPDLVLEVRDDGAATASPETRRGYPDAGTFGVGLVGMRERVAAVGGALDFDRTDAGAVLRVRLPGSVG